MSKKILLVGNPNVGKSSLFNNLTGLKQHTGNWTGKTVDYAIGSKYYKDEKLDFIDLPGTYSLNSYSEEEKVTCKYIEEDKYNLIIVVIDATTINRGLKLLKEVLNKNKNVILCINLIDEAKKKNIFISFSKLKKIFGIPVVPISAKNNYNIDKLLDEVINFKCQNESKEYDKLDVNDVVNECVLFMEPVYAQKERKIDKILTDKITGIPIMLVLLFLILWITIYLSNFPSDWLFSFFNYFEGILLKFFDFLKVPAIVTNLLVLGIYKTVTWVISVMLPPMIIFFPFFTILEDYGFLPRISFNMDHLFCKCKTSGKQCLTMLMGFGCNAIGVTGTRIIESKKEKIIAVLTNVFIPCNGRFPTILALISMFLVVSSNRFFTSSLSALFLTLIIIFSIIVTLIVSKILSLVLFKNEKSTFILELPQYRRPKFLSVITKAVWDRTLFILGKAIAISVPAGMIIYLFANFYIGNVTLLEFLALKLNSIGLFLGLDGMILIAFLLGFPANEIVVPILLMGYLKTGVLTSYESLDSLKNILVTNGWTLLTAINFIIMSIFHFPCSTTFITIKKELGSNFWCLIAFILPLLIGIVLCLITKFLWFIF